MIEEKILNIYSKEIAKYGVTDRKSLFWTKDKQDIRFNILLGESLRCSKMSILDYGCGISDLNDFLKRNRYNLIYNGCDINDSFVQESLNRYPKENVFLIDSVNDVADCFDIVLVSGTFNLTGLDSYEEMEEYVFSNILKLFQKTNYMLCINFLSHTTDEEYKYDGHFYLDPSKLYAYASEKMTSRIEINTSSLPYEITMKFYKDQSIDMTTVLYKDN